MRISDWSSDVCSSDLDDRVSGEEPAAARRWPEVSGAVGGRLGVPAVRHGLDLFAVRQPRFLRSRRLFRSGRQPDRDARWCDAGDRAWLQAVAGAVPSVDAGRLRGCAGRSEEHTSELQSLMRSSYAVFCLKKKTII